MGVSCPPLSEDWGYDFKIIFYITKLLLQSTWEKLPKDIAFVLRKKSI